MCRQGAAQAAAGCSSGISGKALPGSCGRVGLRDCASLRALDLGSVDLRSFIKSDPAYGWIARVIPWGIHTFCSPRTEAVSARTVFNIAASSLRLWP